jgi:hypothetical protein
MCYVCVLLKQKPTAKRVTKSFDQRTCGHRADFEHCPSCDARFDDQTWDEAAVIMSLEVTGGKHGSVVIVSECPKCFEKSWVHNTFCSLSCGVTFPEHWRKAAAEEHTRRHTAAVHVFTDSLCAQCAHLRKLECDTLPLVDCTDGKDEHAKLPPGRELHLRHSFSEAACTNFKQR